MLRSCNSLRNASFPATEGSRDTSSASEKFRGAEPSPERFVSVLPSRPEPVPRSPLVAKISNFVTLSTGDIEILNSLCRGYRTFEADQNLIEEGFRPGCAYIMLSGLAFRYKMLEGGRRQILGYLVPGDICDLSFMLVEQADYSVAVLIKSRVAKLPIARLREAVRSSFNVRRGLQLAAHLDNVMMREWMLNVGQMKAHQRLSHFFCEMAERLRLLGEVSEDGSFDFPLNQYILADTIGTTTVHVNRTLQRLRQEGLIALNHKRLRIFDPHKLAAVANFQGQYLKRSTIIEHA